MNSIWITYAVVSAICIAIAAIGGMATNGTPWAVFIDRRNTWSLTQLQLGLWALIVIPVLVTFAAVRAMHDPSSAWDFIFPGEDWVILGISLGSTTTAVIVKSLKDRPIGTGALAAGARILTRPAATDAKLSDILTYDEGTNPPLGFDITKYQNLLFTLALAGVWLWNAMWMFSKARVSADLSTLPGMNQTALAILAVSHAGYIVGKAVPQS